MKKRALALALAFALCLACATSASAVTIPSVSPDGAWSETTIPEGATAEVANIFPDVSREDWFHDAVQYTVDHELVIGMPNSDGVVCFMPSGTMTRAQFVTIMYRYAGSPAQTLTISNFSDVPAQTDGNKWYFSAMTWGVQNELIYGYSDGTFRPQDPVKREELVTLLQRFTKNFLKVTLDADTSLALESFVDFPRVQSYAKEAMLWAVQAKIIDGIPNGGYNYLQPGGESTRAQVAQIFKKWGTLSSKTQVAGPGGSDSLAEPSTPVGRTAYSFSNTAGDNGFHFYNGMDNYNTYYEQKLHPGSYLISELIYRMAFADSSEAAVLSRRSVDASNAVFWKGSCFGMVSTAAMMAMSKTGDARLAPSTFGPAYQYALQLKVDLPAPVSSLRFSDGKSMSVMTTDDLWAGNPAIAPTHQTLVDHLTLTQIIELMQVAQSTDGFWRIYDDGEIDATNNAIEKIRAQMRAYANGEGAPVCIAMGTEIMIGDISGAHVSGDYSNATHAVLGCDIHEESESANTFSLTVYDPNYGAEEQTVQFEKDADGNWTWGYLFNESRDAWWGNLASSSRNKETEKYTYVFHIGYTTYDQIASLWDNLGNLEFGVKNSYFTVNVGDGRIASDDGTVVLSDYSIDRDATTLEEAQVVHPVDANGAAEGSMQLSLPFGAYTVTSDAASEDTLEVQTITSHAIVNVTAPGTAAITTATDANNVQSTSAVIDGEAGDPYEISIQIPDADVEFQTATLSGTMADTQLSATLGADYICVNGAKDDLTITFGDNSGGVIPYETYHDGDMVRIYPKNDTRLESPQNTTWESMTATWDAVPDATAYEVQLYQDGATVGKPLTTTELTADFASQITAGGQYTYALTAIDDTKSHTSSIPANSPPVTVYQVTFDTMGFSETTVAYVLAGQSVSFPNIPTTNGYNIQYWSSAEDDSGDVYDKSQPVTPTGDAIFYAKWNYLLQDIGASSDCPAYLIGYPDGTVHPDGTATRAEVAIMIYRASSAGFDDAAVYQFLDVRTQAWYNEAISALAGGGYIDGYPDGTFRPNKRVTRGEFAAMLLRKFVTPGSDDSSSFVDVDGHWASPYIEAGETSGFLEGYPDGTFRPDQTITRAEVAKIINRVFGRGDAKDATSISVSFPDNTASAWYAYEILNAANTHRASISGEWEDIVSHP